MRMHEGGVWGECMCACVHERVRIILGREWCERAGILVGRSVRGGALQVWEKECIRAKAVEPRCRHRAPSIFFLGCDVVVRFASSLCLVK